MHWRVQRRAARWISNKHDRTTSVTAVLHQVHLESFEECRWISRQTFVYKILNEHVAVLMNHLDLVLCNRPVRVLSGIRYHTPSPCWLWYHLSEANHLRYRAHRRAHFIAAMSTRSLAVIRSRLVIDQLNTKLEGTHSKNLFVIALKVHL